MGEFKVMIGVIAIEDDDTFTINGKKCKCCDDLWFRKVCNGAYVMATGEDCGEYVQVMDIKPFIA